MRQMYLRRWSTQDVAPGADEALVSWPVPNESIINSVTGTIHMVSLAAAGLTNAVSFGIEGWMLQTDDIATDFADQTAIWDTSVPKDDGSEVLDSGFAPQAGSMFEPGLIDAAQMFDQELLSPHRIFQVNPILTLASRPVGFVPGTPSTFHPTAVIEVDVKGRYKLGFDGALVFGAGSPAWDATVNNDIIQILGTHQKALYAMAHIDDVLDKAMIDFLVLTEAGATAPYDDIMTWLMNLLDTVQEETTASGGFLALTLTFTTKMIAGIAVPGTMRGRTLGPDMQAS